MYIEGRGEPMHECAPVHIHVPEGVKLFEIEFAVSLCIGHSVFNGKVMSHLKFVKY